MARKTKLLSAVTLPARTIPNKGGSFVDVTREKVVGAAQGRTTVDAQFAADTRRAGGNSTDRLQGRSAGLNPKLSSPIAGSGGVRGLPGGQIEQRIGEAVRTGNVGRIRKEGKPVTKKGSAVSRNVNIKGRVRTSDKAASARAARAGTTAGSGRLGVPDRKPATISIGRAAISAPSGGIRKLGRKPFDI